MRVAAQPHPVLEHDQRNLGVSLEAEHAVGDVRADFLELLRPVQIARFIESCRQLDDAGDLLPRFRGLDQRTHERRVVTDAIDGHLDRQRPGVVGRLDG